MKLMKRREKDPELVMDADDELIDYDYYGDSSKGANSFDDEESAEETTARNSAMGGVNFEGNGAPVALKVVRPKSFDEGPEIADYLKEGSTVLLNIEQLDKLSTKRLLDFLLGATHVLGGSMNVVAKGTFVFAPKSVGVSDTSIENDADEDEAFEEDNGVIID